MNHVGRWNMNMRLATGALSSFGPASETCVRTESEYEEIAVALAQRKMRIRMRNRLYAEWRLAHGGKEEVTLSNMEDINGNTLPNRTGLEGRPLFDTNSWVKDFEGGLRMMADMSASGIGRGDSEAQFYAGSGAGGKGRRPHLVRAHQSDWGPRSRLF
mmetsp:Transcript_45085/g.141943  ORF Transcript_45085/g.141943 Transcript_45085/m.141943 type:complete len:158 (-) Transcript_45085:1958-2431(-)